MISDNFLAPNTALRKSTNSLLVLYLETGRPSQPRDILDFKKSSLEVSEQKQETKWTEKTFYNCGKIRKFEISERFFV